MSSLSSMIFLFIIIFVILYLRNEKQNRESDDRFTDPANGQQLRWDSHTHSVYLEGESRPRSGDFSRSTPVSHGYTGGYDERREIREAIAAGESALSSLRDAERKLQSARGWGLMDMFGGGIISGAIKHSRVSEAQRYIDDARMKLSRFRNELSDIQSVGDLDIRVGDFLTFADFFFDGFLADIMVQSRISEARTKLQNAIREVENMLNRLYAMH